MSGEGKRQCFTRAEAAALCGLSSRQFDEVIRPRAGKGAEKGAGKTLRFDGAMVVAALVAYRVEQAKPAADLAESDPLLAGSNSPALERYRLGRAQMVELDLAERGRELVRVTVLQDAMRPALTALRSTGDRLVRRFGNEAGEIYNEGVSEFESAALRALNLNGTHGTGEGGSDADPPVGGGGALAPPADPQ